VLTLGRELFLIQVSARTRALGRGRLCLRGQPPVGLAGRFSGRGILGNGGSLPILLADNYIRTPNDLTTEAQSAQRTHRDESLAMVRAVSSLTILASYRKQRPAASEQHRRRCPGCASPFAACELGRPGCCAARQGRPWMHAGRHFMLSQKLQKILFGYVQLLENFVEKPVADFAIAVDRNRCRSTIGVLSIWRGFLSASPSEIRAPLRPFAGYELWQA
jgi:hypothetical protein